MTGTLRDDQNKFLTMCRSILLRKSNISEKSCRKNQNTNLVFNNFFFENLPFMRQRGRML